MFALLYGIFVLVLMNNFYSDVTSYRQWIPQLNADYLVLFNHIIIRSLVAAIQIALKVEQIFIGWVNSSYYIFEVFLYSFHMEILTSIAAK